MFGLKNWEKASVAEKIKAVQYELDRNIERWHFIHDNGCSDPFWPDGVNMNLKRNHIIYDLRELAKLDCKPRQLSLFEVSVECIANSDVMQDSRIPPEVPNNWMAKDRPCHYFDWKV